MSTPPVPNDPQSGNTPSGQPQYGQNAPQYGQNTQPNPPQYGQNAPQYGQNAPQYGQNAPQYGQPQPPAFGQPAPYASPYGAAPEGPRTIPAQVLLSFKMILVAGALSAIASLVLAFTGAPFFNQMMVEQMAGTGQSLPDGFSEMVESSLVFGGIVGALISIGLYCLVAFPVKKGKNWARILGTVFAVLSIFGLFGGLFAFGALYGILQLVSILLGVAAIVLLYLPANSPYFSKQNPNFSAGAPYGR